MSAGVASDRNLQWYEVRGQPDDFIGASRDLGLEGFEDHVSDN